MTSDPASAQPATTACWCCGEDRVEAELTRLDCHDEVALRDVCIEWLGGKRYGPREGRHVEPDGNVIRFGSLISPSIRG